MLATTGRAMAVAKSATVSLGSAGPPEGWYVSPTGSATGAGTYADPWDLATAVAGGNGYHILQPGDNVWIRGGLYQRQNVFSLNGSAGNYIKFQNYPGERVRLDGCTNVNDRGNNMPVKLNSTGSYVWLQGVEIFISQTERHRESVFDNERKETVWAIMPHGKVVNCHVHDGGGGIYVWSAGHNQEIYGNIIQHSGTTHLISEKNCTYAIDLTPVGGQTITLGNFSSGSTTVSHNHDADANYLVVAIANVPPSADRATHEWDDMTVQWNGTGMTPLGGMNSWNEKRRDNYQGDLQPGDDSSIGLWVLSTTDTGTHNLTITGTLGTVRSMIQSFKQVSSAAALRGEFTMYWEDQPLLQHLDSTSGHVVVDGFALYGNLSGYAVHGPSDNSLVHANSLYVNPGVAPGLGMSYASGAAITVDLTVNDAAANYSHGDAPIPLCQLTSATGGFTQGMVGYPISITGAAYGGGTLYTTIASVINSNTIEIQFQPAQDISGQTATVYHGGVQMGWAWTDDVDSVGHGIYTQTTAVAGEGHVFKENILYDQLGTYAMQAYGADFRDSTVEGNFATYNGWIIGDGNMTDTTFSENMTHGLSVTVGYGGPSTMSGVGVQNNYIDGDLALPATTKWAEITVGGTGDENTVTGDGTPAGAETQFPDNDWNAAHATNVIIVRPNAYETNRCNVFVWNWENDATVDLEPSITAAGAVAEGTAIYVLHAQNFFGDPVWTGTYNSGSAITISMAAVDLPPAAGIGTIYGGGNYMGEASTAPAFAAFVIRAQSEEAWR